MTASRSVKDKADVYAIMVSYYDNGMTMFDGEVVAGKGTSRQEAEKVVKAKLHSLAESFRLIPQS